MHVAAQKRARPYFKDALSLNQIFGA